MNLSKDHGIYVGTEGSLLDNVERAVSEKMQTGWADEALYGFAARVANATPPADEAFRQALRSRILVDLVSDATAGTRAKAAGGRVQTVRLWRFALAGTLAAALVLITVFAAAWRIHRREPGMEMEAEAPAVVPAGQLVFEDVDALVDRLNEDQDPTTRTVVVFPGDHAAALEGRVQHRVLPLSLDGALTPAAIQSALGAVLPSSGLVDVIMVNQKATDTARQVQIALERRLYRLYRLDGAAIETFGALERSQFVVGPEDGALEPIGAVFESGLELVAGRTLDEPQPGAPLRLAFEWRVEEPVSDSLVMFAHFVHGDRLVAQRDAVPGNGLFPVESWVPGELVRDQFALLLPSELPAGEYEIRVGIYSATGGQRYSLVEPDGGVWVVVQRFTIEDADEAE